MFTMSQALIDAAKAAYDHEKALAAAQDRHASLITEVQDAAAAVELLKQARAGIEWNLWNAALTESEPEKAEKEKHGRASA